MTELEQLRGECALLREALEYYANEDNWIYHSMSGDDYYASWCEIEGNEEKAKQALASSPLSEKVAAVVRLSTELRAAMTATEVSSELSEFSLLDRENCLFEEWKSAVDALQEAAK